MQDASPLTPAPKPTQHADDAAYYRAVLHELIDLGTDLARTVHAQAQAASPAEAPALLASFERIARTVRRTVLLAQATAERATRPATRPAPLRTASATPDPLQDPVHALRHVIRRVENSIERHTAPGHPPRHTPEHADRLHAELLERVERPEFAHDLMSRPMADLIDEICTDLGLDNRPGQPPWPRRTPHDLAMLHARAQGQRPDAPRPRAPAQAPQPATRPHSQHGAAPEPSGPDMQDPEAQDMAALVQMARALAAG